MKIAIVFFFIVAVILKNIPIYATPVVVSGGPENDYESWIIRLNDSRLMLIFCRNPDWESGDLYATFSSDEGDSWSAPQAIISEPGDQATLSFAQLPGDTLRLWYASNESGNYRIYSAYSLDGLAWIQEGALELGWELSDMYYDPTVVLETDNSLTMSYVVSGGGGYIAHCPYSGSWDTDRTLVAPSGFRTRVMKHDDGTYLYTYHRQTGGSYEYDVFIRTSNDRVDWAEPVRLTTNLNSHDSFPNQMSDGAFMVYYAKYEAPAYNIYRRRSGNAVDWEDEEQITCDSTNNTQPHFFVESGQIYLVWAHAVDFPYDHDVYFEKSLDMTQTEEHVPIPQIFSISVYPNPFNSAVRCQISGVVGQEIGIEIYDLRGDVVATPFNMEAQQGIAKGKERYAMKSTHWCPDESISSGIYLVRATAGEKTTIKKVVFLR